MNHCPPRNYGALISLHRESGFAQRYAVVGLGDFGLRVPFPSRDIVRVSVKRPSIAALRLEEDYRIITLNGTDK